MNNIENKSFLVTGATSGIGKQLVKTLVDAGANVAFCGRSSDKLNTVISSLTLAEQRIHSQAFDITDYEKISSFVTASIEKFGTIDCLINCAGANSARGTISEMKVEDLEWMTKVNMFAPFVFMQEVYNQTMLPRKKGNIINVMSTVSLFANAGIGAYTGSKSGFDGLTKVFRKEARDNNVKVCAIYPGGVDSPFREADRPEYLHVDDVVEAIMHIASQPDSVCTDELVVRPMVERNFA